MNLGQLEEENEKFVNAYKEYGYATKTQLANEAFKLLRRKKAKVAREKWLADAFTEVAEVKRDVFFETIDGEDFVDKDR